jgi:cardiolipin synthase A/B
MQLRQTDSTPDCKLKATAYPLVVTACETAPNYNWLCTGRDVFPAMLEAIDTAQKSVFLEVYMFVASPLGEQFRAALIRARRRGAKVQVMVDALGSMALSSSFWNPLVALGGEFRFFNPRILNRFGVRDHRKLLVCDERIAFIGGFNIAPEYEGDGVTCGWCDIGLKLEGPLVAQLAASFQEMFERAGVRHQTLLRFASARARKTAMYGNETLLLSGPGRGASPIKQALRRDLDRAHSVQVIVAYFLPTWRLRRALTRVVHLGGKVEMILAGKSDVTLSRLAGQSLYRRFLKAGVDIHEYQPQILHAKLIIIDDIVYVGSANLDQRSLNINYELMSRFDSKEVAAQAREVFRNTMRHSHQITREHWQRSRTIWRRLKQHWAYFLLVRMDPIIARWRLKVATD